MTKKRVDEANLAYYLGQKPTMTDREFDRLFREVYGDKAPLDHFREQIAAGEGAFTKKRRLAYPMLSLRKVRTETELEKWMKGLPEGATVHLSPKWDGLACQVTCDESGTVVSATTRGDGTVGEDVTKAVAVMQKAGKLDMARPGTFAVEIGITPEDMASLPEYTKLRSAAAGILRRSAEDGGENAGLLCAREHWVTDSSSVEGDDMNSLLRAYIDTLGPDEMDTDGVVLVAQKDGEPLRELGSNGAYPLWAVAWKFENQTTVAHLSDVVWNQGRAKVTPVAVFDPPVIIDGSSVTRASLHNMDTIEELGVAIGDEVLVTLSNEIIPQVVGVHEKGAERTKIEPVEHGGPTLESRIALIFEVMNVDSAGPAVVSQFCNRVDAQATTPEILETIYQTTARDMVAEFERFGDKKAEALESEITRRFNEADPHQWLATLGMSGIGRRVSSKLLGHFDGFDGFMECEWDDLLAVDGIGSAKVDVLEENWDRIESLYDFLDDYGFATEYEEGDDEEPTGPLSGKNIVVTGKITGGTRKEIAALIESLGGKVQSSVTKDTDMLLTDKPSTSSKFTKAQSLGTEIIFVSSADDIRSL